MKSFEMIEKSFWLIEPETIRLFLFKEKDKTHFTDLRIAKMKLIYIEAT